MKIIQKVLIFLGILFLISCGSDPVQKADQMVKEGKFSQSIAYYEEGLKEKPDDAGIKTKIAMAYLLNGKTMLEQTGNAESAEKNINKAIENFSDPLSDDLKSTYSQIVIAIASVAGKKDPEMGLKKLEASERYIPEDPAVKAKMEELGKLVVQGYFENGKKKYLAGSKRTGGYDMFEAEQWMTKVVKIDPANKEAARMLSDARRRNLGILDGEQPLPIRLKSVPILYSNIQVYNVRAENATRSSVTIDRNKFTILDKNGKRYNPQPDEHRAYTAPMEASKTLNYNEGSEGEIVYEIPDGTSLWKMVYDDGRGNRSEKFFP